MGLLQGIISKDPDSPTFAVFNTLNWSRSGLVEIYIDHQILPQGKKFAITDSNGKAAPAQPLSHRSDGTYWGIWVSDVPPMGFKTCRIVVDPASDIRSTPSGQEPVINPVNPFYDITLDIQSGTIKSLYDKELNLELIDQGAEWKFGQVVHETLGNRSQIESLTLNNFNRQSLDTVWFEAYEEGPVWNTIRFKGESKSTIGPAGFLLEMRLFNTVKRIDLVYRLRKQLISDPESIYLSFPFLLENGKIFCEVQGGVMEAGVDQIPGSTTDWNTVQNFAAIRNNHSQIILTSNKIPLMQFGGINTGRYQYGAKPASTHIYGWPMNNYWTTNFNADQRGELTFSYSMTSSGDPGNLASTRFGWGCRVPFLSRVIPPGEPNGNPLEKSILSIGSDNLLLINSKPLEGENGIILQLREAAGQPALFSFRTIRKIRVAATVTDATGKPLGGNSGEILFKPFESKFIKLSW
jgi:hypothetical protein